MKMVMIFLGFSLVNFEDPLKADTAVICSCMVGGEAFAKKKTGGQHIIFNPLFNCFVNGL